MSKRKVTRNRRIYDLHTDGLSTYILARRYHISPPAVLKIIHRERRERELQMRGGQV